MVKFNEKLLKQLKLAQAEPFKYIAFSGGGAKGNIYSGVYDTLTEYGILGGIEEVAGSSAGAITATLTATGISAKRFRQIGQNTNFIDLLGSGIKLPATDIKINAGAQPLENLIRNTVNQNIKSFLKKADISELCNTRLESINNELLSLQNKKDLLSLERLQNLDKQKKQLEEIITNSGSEFKTISNKIQKGGKITFKDLDLLHILNPVKFKSLIITATNNQTGELMLFNARDTPNVEIAKAAHASCCIPYVFKPVTINNVQYADGGCYDNIPLKYFNGKNPQNDIENLLDQNEQINKASQEGRKLALAFSPADDLNTKLNMAIYGQKPGITDQNFLFKVISVILKIVQMMGFAKSLIDYKEKVENTYQEVRNNALNTIGLDTKNVGTLSFKEAQEEADYLYVKGSLQAARYFENYNIGTKSDNNLENKEFILQFYENANEKEETNFIKSWTNKIIGKKQDKKNLEDIFNLCKSEAWKERTAQEIFANFIKICGTLDNSKITTKTSLMDKLIISINDRKTPDVVKEKFAQLTQIEIPNRIVDLKFKSTDFNRLLKSSKLMTKNSQERITKKILKDRGNKEISMVDKVKNTENMDIQKD